MGYIVPLLLQIVSILRAGVINFECSFSISCDNYWTVLVVKLYRYLKVG